MHSEQRQNAFTVSFIQFLFFASNASRAQELFALIEKDDIVNLSTVEKQQRGKPIEFVGMQFTEVEDGEWLDQSLYIRNKLKDVDSVVQFREAERRKKGRRE